MNHMDYDDDDEDEDEEEEEEGWRREDGGLNWDNIGRLRGNLFWNNIGPW